MPPLARRLLTMPLVGLILAGVSTAQAQSFYYKVEGSSYQGSLTQLGRSGLVLESNGAKMPVRFYRETELTVYGVGDRAFLRPGVHVTVSGKLNAQKLERATVSVHLNPQQTAKQGEVRVSSDSKDLTIRGVVQSLEPFVIKTTDLVRFEVREGGVALPTPPMAAGKPLLVELQNAAPQQVPLIIGSALKLASPGDRVSVFIPRRRPGMARTVSITKNEPLKFEELANRGRKSGGKGTKSAKGKSAAGKADAPADDADKSDKETAPKSSETPAKDDGT